MRISLSWSTNSEFRFWESNVPSQMSQLIYSHNFTFNPVSQQPPVQLERGLHWGTVKGIKAGFGNLLRSLAWGQSWWGTGFFGFPEGEQEVWKYRSRAGSITSSYSVMLFMQPDQLLNFGQWLFETINLWYLKWELELSVKMPLMISGGNRHNWVTIKSVHCKCPRTFG